MTPRKAFQRIDVWAARKLVSRDDVLIIDVRDAKAYKKSHIPKAKNVTIANLAAILDSIPKDTPIVIYCYRGYASQEYAQIFCDFRFQEVYSLDSGYEGWEKQAELRPKLTDWLVANGFSLDSLNTVLANNTTPLMKAALEGDLDVVIRLIEAGADVTMRNSDGNNALWLACVGGHLDVIDALIAANIDIDNRNDNEATALMYASSAGKADVVRHLLRAGADKTFATIDGFTAIDMAASFDCLKLLRDGARIAETTAAERDTPRAVLSLATGNG